MRQEKGQGSALDPRRAQRAVARLAGRPLDPIRFKRRLVVVIPLALGACGLSTRPYVERRQWPLRVSRPQSLPPRRGGPVLLVRSFTAGPGMDARGLQSIEPDGSIRTDFYEEWSVAPAQAVEDGLRGWLAASGLFSAVLAPGSRLQADLVLEAELTALWTVPAENRARAALGFTVLRDHAPAASLLVQSRIEAAAALGGTTAQDAAQAMTEAVARLCGQVEAALRTARIS